MPNFIIKNDNTSEKTRNLPRLRTASKTVRKFTQHFAADELPHSVCVNLDWLSFMCECSLPEPLPDQEHVWASDSVVMEYLKRGSTNFQHQYLVYLHGEPVANVHTHTRNPKIIKEGTAKLEILNHVLYSSTVLEVLAEVMTACQMPVIKNVSGFHISIDGVKHVHKLCNMYLFQNRDRTGMPNVKKLGRWDKSCKLRLKGRARLDPKVFNKSTGDCDNFKFGTGHKYITVYNKTTELEKSQKHYIKSAWEKAGIDMTGTVWRCELRMDSQGVKEIKGFDLKRIQDPNYLLSLFKTQCKNFFEFVLEEGDGNVSRMRVIDIFQFEKLKVPLLEKIPRDKVRGAYKAKMAIHHIVQCICLKYYNTEASIKNALSNMADTINMYHLQEWYDKRRQKWIETYNPKERVFQMGDGRPHL